MHFLMGMFDTFYSSSGPIPTMRAMSALLLIKHGTGCPSPQPLVAIYRLVAFCRINPGNASLGAPVLENHIPGRSMLMELSLGGGLQKSTFLRPRSVCMQHVSFVKLTRLACAPHIDRIRRGLPAPW